jgi:hypothetical protein
MVPFLASVLRFSLNVFRSRETILSENAVLKSDFVTCGLVSVNTAVEAPNMDSIMERLFRTVRREALDSFLLRGRDQTQLHLRRPFRRFLLAGTPQ